MSRLRQKPGLPALSCAVLLAASAAGDARAEAHDTCAGFIDAVPTVITTQGLWCLRRDVSTSIASGRAVDIQANNVAIDCNDFKIGGLAAGPASMAIGIHANGRQNITVRNCGVRGFRMGMSITGGAGHLVEDNRLDGNLYVGLNVTGENALVRRNRVYDTGGATAAPPSETYGIYAAGDVIDNIVDGVRAVNGDNAIGIRVNRPGDTARGNIVRNLVPNASGAATGVAGVANAVLLDNVIDAGAPVLGVGVRWGAICANNVSTGMTFTYLDCVVTSTSP